MAVSVSIWAMTWTLYALDPGTACYILEISLMPLHSTVPCVSFIYSYYIYSQFVSFMLAPKEKMGSTNKVFLYSFLVREGGERQVEMVVQVEAADHSWVWLYMVLQLETGEHPITCQNYVIRYYPF